MNNRLKFRAWKKASKEMYNVIQLGFNNVDFETSYICVDKTDNDDIHGILLESVEEYILMQCTGLKDENDKLIYDGDIVNCHVSIRKQYLYQVKYENGSFMLVSPYEKNSNLYPLFQLCPECENEEDFVWPCEVIGNIYENSELLEGKWATT